MDITESNEWKSFSNYYNDNKLIDQIGLFRYEDLHTNYKNINNIDDIDKRLLETTYKWNNLEKIKRINIIYMK